MKSSECELITTCPYYNNARYGCDIPEQFKEQYCRGIYVWCGRYLAYRTGKQRIPQTAFVSRR